MRKTASLDRIDSSKGYTEDNVWWINKHVNIMKNVYELDYFLDICSLITKKNERDSGAVRVARPQKSPEPFRRKAAQSLLPVGPPNML